MQINHVYTLYVCVCDFYTSLVYRSAWHAKEQETFDDLQFDVYKSTLTVRLIAQVLLCCEVLNVVPHTLTTNVSLFKLILCFLNNYQSISTIVN